MLGSSRLLEDLAGGRILRRLWRLLILVLCVFATTVCALLFLAGAAEAQESQTQAASADAGGHSDPTVPATVATSSEHSPASSAIESDSTLVKAPTGEGVKPDGVVTAENSRLELANGETQPKMADPADAGDKSTSSTSPGVALPETSSQSATSEPQTVVQSVTGPPQAIFLAANPPVGQIEEFLTPTQPSRPFGIVLGPDNAFWFTEFVGNRIGRADLNGVITNEFPLPALGSNPGGITVGPDNAIWFTEVGSPTSIGRIGRIDTNTFVITEPFLLPSGSQPLDIMMGSDGALWFTEQGVTPAQFLPFLTPQCAAGCRIGRIAPDLTTLTHFPIPDQGTGICQNFAITQCSNPTKITQGPNGFVWFSATGAAQVGRLNMSTGAVDAFSTPGGASQTVPTGMTLGPDNNIWFVGFNPGQVGMIDPAAPSTATMVMFDIPPGPGQIGSPPCTVLQCAPFDLLTGSDGNLWFTDCLQLFASGTCDLSQAFIRSFNPTLHAFSAFGDATPHGYTGITAGPTQAGFLWFGDATTNSVGRIFIGIPPTPPPPPTPPTPPTPPAPPAPPAPAVLPESSLGVGATQSATVLPFTGVGHLGWQLLIAIMLLALGWQLRRFAGPNQCYRNQSPERVSTT